MIDALLAYEEKLRTQCSEIITETRVRMGGGFFNTIFLSIVFEHALDLTIATSVASLFRRVEPTCITEMH